jgi:ABC-2 type transport system ATP-binding protein
MTVRRYLRFVAALKDVPKAGVPRAVDLAIDRARLGDVADRRIATLSKGYRQRVGLAQAIVHEPPVLILDEPTSSLDPKQRAEVRELIVGLKGRHTVILSTHILSEVSEVADRVVILHRGSVKAVDTPARLGARLSGREATRIAIAGTTGAAGPTPDAVRDALAALPGAGRITTRMNADGTIDALVESDRGTDLRADAAALVVAKGWRLVGLAGESLSLEDVFLALTSDEQGGA